MATVFDDGLFGKTWREAKRELLDAFEREFWARLHARCGGNVSEMAREASTERQFVRAYLHRHKIAAAGPRARRGEIVPGSCLAQVLSALAHGPLRPSEIARAIDKDPTTVSAALFRASARGRGAPTWAIFSQGGSKITSCEPSSARQ